VVTKYYFAGASRIATLAPHCVRCSAGVKKNNVVTYLVGDHLGSTSLTVNSSTGEIVETRYKPCPYRVLREGEVRWTTADKTLPTRFLPSEYYLTANTHTPCAFSIFPACLTSAPRHPASRLASMRQSSGCFAIILAYGHRPNRRRGPSAPASQRAW